MAELNRRFVQGVPSNDLRSAGVLLRQFDKLDDGLEGRPWLPCPESGWANWCHRFHSIWAASLVLPGGATQLYKPDVGGLVLAPSANLLCAYPADGNSMSDQKLCDEDEAARWDTCLPGCTCPLGVPKNEAGSCFEGRPPVYLEQVMREHMANAAARNGYNEMVIDTDSVVSRLPRSIDAFFFLRGGEEGEARTAHAEFLTVYPDAASSVPLVEFDFYAEAPFRLVS